MYGSQSLKYLPSLPLQKQTDNSVLNPKICKLFKLPYLNPTLHHFSRNSNSHIHKSISFSMIRARGRMDLDTILTLLGISSLPLHIQRTFLCLCLVCLFIGSANLIPFTFCCRFFSLRLLVSFLSFVGMQWEIEVI